MGTPLPDPRAGGRAGTAAPGLLSGDRRCKAIPSRFILPWLVLRSPSGPGPQVPAGPGRSGGTPGKNGEPGERAALPRDPLRAGPGGGTGSSKPELTPDRAALPEPFVLARVAQRRRVGDPADPCDSDSPGLTLLSGDTHACRGPCAQGR